MIEVLMIVVLVWVHKRVGVGWRVKMVKVRLLVAALGVVATAFIRVVGVIARLVVLPLTLVKVSWLLEYESWR